MAEDLRAQLLKVLWEAPYDHEDQVDALLPVVLAYVSDQLVTHRDCDSNCPHDAPGDRRCHCKCSACSSNGVDCRCDFCKLINPASS